MILQTLTAYYDTLLERGTPGVPRYGWSAARVSCALALSPKGEPQAVVSLLVEAQRGKKTVEVPQVLQVPFQQEKGAGFNPNFLCDNAAFLLGLDTKGKPDRARKAFEATRELHLRLLENAAGTAAKAVREFFLRWDPADAAVHPVLASHLERLFEGNLVFRIGGVYAQDDPELQAIWQTSYDRPDPQDPVMPCLVTGRPAPIARTHPIIRGIRNAPTTGSKLVGFNDPAYESYGKTQSYNAPVGNASAFAYSTALNYLLSQPEHRKFIGNLTLVYWAESGEEVYSSCFSQMLDPAPEMDEALLDRIMDSISKGLPVDESGFILNPDMPFYILGLSPNAARVSVRFFLQNSFGDFLKNINAHYDRIRIVRPHFDRRVNLAPRELLWETVNKNARDKSPRPDGASGLLEAILRNFNYPEILFSGTMLRITAEHDVTRGQAAILKAYLLKNSCSRSPNSQLKEAATVELNETCTYPPYLLGRLFSVLESIQEASVEGKLNSTIKDRFFASAGTTPAPIFAQLFRLEASHMKKLHRDKPGLAVALEQQKGELIAALTESIPKHLDLEDQCTFRIGYYHQTQKRYQKKEEKANV